MKPFESSKRVLTWCCICSDENTTKLQKLAHIIFTMSVIVFLMISVSMTGAYGFTYITIDLEGALYAVFPFFGIVSTNYLIIAAFFSRRKINAIFETLSVIYEANAKPDSTKRFAALNERNASLWHSYAKFIVISVSINSLVIPAGFVWWQWRTQSSFDVDNLFHPYTVLLPWDQSTPFGYIAEISITVFGASAYYIVVGNLIILFILMCLQHHVFFEIFEHSLLEFDRTDKRPHHLHGLIRFHVSVKAWFVETADTYSPFVLTVLISNVLMLACCALQVDLILKHVNLTLLPVLAAGSIGMVGLFTFCYFGKMATESYEKMSDSLYECNWFEYSINTQKYIWLMIMNAQPPLYYHGFGMAVLNLDTFCSLIRTVVTYFMAFKTLTE